LREPFHRFFSGNLTTVVNVEFPIGLTTSATIEKVRLGRIGSDLLELRAFAVNGSAANVAAGSTFRVCTHGNLLSGSQITQLSAIATCCC
jgi:hypothetical protein